MHSINLIFAITLAMFMFGCTHKGVNTSDRLKQFQISMEIAETTGDLASLIALNENQIPQTIESLEMSIDSRTVTLWHLMKDNQVHRGEILDTLKSIKEYRSSYPRKKGEVPEDPLNVQAAKLKAEAKKILDAL